MSSYLVMLAFGNFVKQEAKSKSGTSLEFYLDKNDVSKFEPTFRYSAALFDYLEQEIGVKYPWGIYRQVPVRDFLYAGMENTTSTIFSQDFVVDSIGFNDKNYINVNAHELAHQWFGDLITAQSSKHHWLQEGFATYYALLAEKEIFGDDFNKIAVDVLNDIILTSGADLVISSDWRLYATLDEMKDLFHQFGVIKGPIDFTPEIQTLTKHVHIRVEEIDIWLSKHPEVTKWVAIDDMDLGEKIGSISGNSNGGLTNFVKTREREGLKQCNISIKVLRYL